jgi:hypothetical protein
MAGIVPALILFFIYLSISFLDLWELIPFAVKMVWFVIVIASGTFFIVRSFQNRKADVSFGLITKRLKLLAVSIVIFAVLALYSKEDFSRLITLALMPQGIFQYPTPEVTVTITPPSYLKQKKNTLVLGSNPQLNQPIAHIYEGSILDIKVANTRWQPKIRFSDDSIVLFEQQDDHSFIAQTKITDQTKWWVAQGTHILADFPIMIIEDKSPTIISFEQEEGKNEKGYMAFKIAVEDDYNIIGARLDVLEMDVPNDNIVKRVIDSHLLSISDIKSYQNVFYIDLSASGNFGKTATLRLSVEDEAGQTSDQFLDNVSIPERVFTNITANKLNLLRKDLNDQTSTVKSISRQLEMMSQRDELEHFPPVYYLGLRSAYWRLVSPSSAEDAKSVKKILWDIALAVEEGGVNSYENSLIFAFDELILMLNQEKPYEDIREALNNIDTLFKLYSDAVYKSNIKRKVLQIDFKSLRKLYGYILVHSAQKNFHDASLIADMIRKGLLRNDEMLLGIRGFDRYMVLSQGKILLENLIAIQKNLLASSYNEQLNNRLASSSNVDRITDAIVQKQNKNIVMQSKVGDTVKLLEQKIMTTGYSNEYLFQNATDLVEEILLNMKTSEVVQVAQFQSELVTVLSDLKKLLNGPVTLIPELQNVIPKMNESPHSKKDIGS